LEARCANGVVVIDVVVGVVVEGGGGGLVLRTWASHAALRLTPYMDKLRQLLPQYKTTWRRVMNEMDNYFLKLL
jgi:hypothetical protein